MILSWIAQLGIRKKTGVPSALYLSRNTECWPTWLVQDLGELEKATRSSCVGKSAAIQIYRATRSDLERPGCPERVGKFHEACHVDFLRSRGRL